MAGRSNKTNAGARTDYGSPPEGWVPRTEDEYLHQQRYIRDMTNDALVEQLERKDYRGSAAMQLVAIRANEEIDRVEDRRLDRIKRISPEDYSSASIGFELEYPGETREA